MTSSMAWVRRTPRRSMAPLRSRPSVVCQAPRSMDSKAWRYQKSSRVRRSSAALGPPEAETTNWRSLRVRSLGTGWAGLETRSCGRGTTRRATREGWMIAVEV
ncbi:hypothetical protein FH972_024911 [Carpinus fangiana]|uniref:Uncharacterized protein n=1 Tax=Carpinus fangiana TaxID=176857 RepID=A0A5N6KZU1_9ROSI|nr:hypothetical protein FH972_024911 [Carpinus fangiana]